MKEHKYSEIFTSFQGEGAYTGKASLWVRWFLCNLNCNGFGQDDPTNPDTYVLPYKDLDLIDIKQVDDLPVFDKGCDSSYSWAKEYRHLAKSNTAVEIADKLTDELRTEFNPDGLFLNPHSKQETHMCFTGGEPLMKHSQLAMTEVLHEFSKRNNCPRFITVETNGTQKIGKDLANTIDLLMFTDEYGGLIEDTRGEPEWFWSVSPKLFHTSGEEAKKAIQPDIVAEYARCSNRGQLKFVVNGSNESWDEVEQVIKQFNDAGVLWPVYIMPEGAKKEQQETEKTKAIVAETIKRGYYVSGRLHCHMLGNQIGT